MKSDENTASDRPEIGEILILIRDETLGFVCMIPLNDTPGYVDIIQGGTMKSDKAEKP